MPTASSTTAPAPVTYTALLRLPGAVAFFLAAGLGRVGIAMTSLGLVWLVHAATGSYATAGTVTAAFAVAEAVAGPQIARLVDRAGQTRVLPAVLAAHAAAVGALLALVAAGAPTWLLATGGVLAGASIPQLGALSAARWVTLLRADPLAPPAALTAAFALESLANAGSYLVGPVLVSAVAASGHPALGTLTAGVLIVAGGSALAAQRRTAPRVHGRAVDAERTDRTPAERTLLSPGFVALIGVSAGTGTFFGAMQVSVAAFVVERGHAQAASTLYGISSASGLLAGWLYGLRRWRAAPSRQLVAATGGLALTCLPLLAVTTTTGLGAAVAVTGLAVPAVLVLTTVLTEARVHRGVLTQAFTWLNSASAAGTAGAAAGAGRAIDVLGAHAGFAVAAAAAATMTLLAAAGCRRGLSAGGRES